MPANFWNGTLGAGRLGLATVPQKPKSQRRTFRKARPPPGSRPGTLALTSGSAPPRIHVYADSPDGVREQDVPDVEELARLIEPETVAWIDVRGLGDERALRRIGDMPELRGRFGYPIVLAIMGGVAAGLLLYFRRRGWIGRGRGR